MSKRGTYNVEKEEKESGPTCASRFEIWWLEFQQKLRLIIHNPNTGEYLTRTPRSWGEIGLFYLAFYTGLAAFFAICMSVFLSATVPAQEDGPKFTHIICTDVGFKASVSDAIQFSVKSTGLPPEMEAYRNDTINFLKSAGYTNDTQRKSLITSSPLNASFPNLMSCNGPNYGRSFEPCVYFRFNRIADYVPADDVRVQCTVDSSGTGKLFEEFKGLVSLDTDPSKPFNNRPLIISPRSLSRNMIAYDPANKDSFQSQLFIAQFYLQDSHWFVRNNPGARRSVALKCEPVLNSSGEGLGAPSEFEVVFHSVA